ncbi:MAG: glutamate synthase subunit alpha, partial [Candidatus Omnitrophica bacterium]|nr:glutamate synthase subunit alpha [Candidatus Omnitrophota bacterium]
LLTTEQLDKFFLDLTDQDLKTSIALVHSRYSTNTFPTWDLSQPFRFLAHNGEINTLDGNINWMRAKEGLLKSVFFGEDIEKIKPVILPGGSDSAAIDNMFELLVLSGRSLAHVMMMLIPGAWQNNSLLSQEIKEFYKFHACFSEPWDGPASIAFTDGLSIGAVLDRNGLRPARYIVTKQNTVVMASEVGVLDIKPEDILISGRLEPGKMLFIDTERGCIVGDEEIKHIAAAKQPYGRWIRDNMIELSDLPSEMECPSDNQDILTLLKSFGYTREDLKIILIPMAENGNEPTGSMGNDTPHAILSNRPQLLYNYFKQRFAQVTNPAIDSIRESCVMSMDSFIGPQKNILDETPEHSHRVRVKNPILNNDDLSKIRNIKVNGFKTKEIFILFEVNE